MEAIITLRNVIEKSIKRQNARLWLMFIDCAKAFDTRKSRGPVDNTQRVWCPTTPHLVAQEAV